MLLTQLARRYTVGVMAGFRVGIAGTAGVIAALALAAPAHALSLRYVSTQESVTGNTQDGVDALYPEDRHVTGGGAFSSGDYDETTIKDSYPIDGLDDDTKPDDGWRVTMDNNTAGFRSVTSLAICAKSQPRYRTADFVSSGVAGIAECPRGTRPSGGGVSSEGTFAQPTIVTNSSPYDGLDRNSRPESWIGRTTQPGFAEIASRIYAICIKKPKPHYRERPFTAAPESQTSQEVRCHEDERVIGIGADTRSGVMAINTMYGFDGGDADLTPDDGAKAYIDNMLNVRSRARRARGLRRLSSPESSVRRCSVRPWRIAILAALAGALALPPAAHTATPGPTVSLGKSRGLEYLSAKFENVVSQTGAPANCDAGDFATGGGGSISGTGINASLNATYPTSPAGAGWQGEGHTIGASGRTVTSYAICGADEVAYQTYDSAIGPNTALVASSPQCALGSVVTGGGVRAQGGDVLVAESRPDSVQRRWDDVVFNPPGSGGSTVSPFVGCSDAYELRYRSSATKVKSDEGGQASARCKRHEAVAGGGFGATLDGVTQYDTWALATRPWDSTEDGNKTPDDGWLARVYNGADGEGQADRVCGLQALRRDPRPAGRSPRG